LIYYFSGTGMDFDTLDQVTTLLQATFGREDWKVTLDELITTARKVFVFDNIAIYMFDQETQSVEVAYARAVGRGKAAEADAAWGEVIAGQVFASEQVILQEPQPGQVEDDRLSQAYMLGLPVCIAGQSSGALVFVRFGGPAFSTEHVKLATLIGLFITQVFERRDWHETYRQLETIRRYAQLQEDFVATISHELRTPLGFIKGYTTTLLRDDTTWDAATQSEFLTIIDEEADRLAELIENVLESARLQSETLEMNFQPLRLDALIRDAVTRAQARHRSLEISMDLEPAPPILGDGVRLAEVFENLFSNAAKYAPDSKIDVFVRSQGEYLQVEFSDHGQGIAEEHLSFIFDRFYRVPNQTGKTGTGLGLYICKQIIQAHHGKIWAESEIGKGTTFFIELPAEKADVQGG
jgi:signal transduction histidine kinase